MVQNRRYPRDWWMLDKAAALAAAEPLSHSMQKIQAAVHCFTNWL
jgi:signal recognition particle subunit SEC65